MWQFSYIWERQQKKEKFFYEEIKNKLHSGNTCYHSVHTTFLKNLRLKYTKL
jgi:hypothetical protein